MNIDLPNVTENLPTTSKRKETCKTNFFYALIKSVCVFVCVPGIGAIIGTLQEVGWSSVYFRRSLALGLGPWSTHWTKLK